MQKLFLMTISFLFLKTLSVVGFLQCTQLCITGCSKCMRSVSNDGQVWTEYCANCTQQTIGLSIEKIQSSNQNVLCTIKMTYASGFVQVYDLYPTKSGSQVIDSKDACTQITLNSSQPQVLNTVQIVSIVLGATVACGLAVYALVKLYGTIQAIPVAGPLPAIAQSVQVIQQGVNCKQAIEDSIAVINGKEVEIKVIQGPDVVDIHKMTRRLRK